MHCAALLPAVLTLVGRCRRSDPMGCEAGKRAQRFLAATSHRVIRVVLKSPPAHQCAWHMSPTGIRSRRDSDSDRAATAFPGRAVGIGRAESALRRTGGEFVANSAVAF